MKVNFADRLIKAVLDKQSFSIAGLDPMFEYIPQHIKDKNREKHGKCVDYACASIYKFNKGIIDGVYDQVPGVKLQSAYYELLGVQGIEVFHKTARYAAEKGLIVIADVKRNDIGSTAHAYSKAYIGEFVICDTGINHDYIDSITVNPYLGTDGIKPFIEDCKNFGKGIFVLVKTSNPSSVEIQDLRTEKGHYIYEIVSQLVNQWGESIKGEYGYSSVGAVVGATFPQQAQKIRNFMPSTIFLVPGYGAQGGSAETVAGCFNEDGLGAVINASRSVNYAYMSEKWKSQYSEKLYGDAARAEIIDMNNKINRELALNKKIPW